MMKLGAHPALRKTSANIDAVVVLPCDPATETVRRIALNAASAADRCSTGMPSRCS